MQAIGKSLELQHGYHREGGPDVIEVQQSLDDLGMPLFDVTFVVFDLETTGGKAGQITEFGAAKIQGGEVIDTFSTLVNPHAPIEPFVVALTGITNGMVANAPDIEEVLPAFLRFAVGPQRGPGERVQNEVVFVAHNARFDMGQLRAAAQKIGISLPPHSVVDTLKLARKTFTADETPNYKLASLARVSGAQIAPTHRALDDALATVDVFHTILARLGGLGVTHLPDLYRAGDSVPEKRRRKAKLADGLPRGPGVYRFIGPDGQVLYVGTSKNIYKRVRQYFTAAETRKRMAEMVDLAVEVRATATNTVIEASVLEVRQIEEFDPPYNRRSRKFLRRPWIALTEEAHPRFIVKNARPSVPAVGPFSSTKQARIALELIEDSIAVRRCKQRLTFQENSGTCCHLLDLGLCSAPCLTGKPQDEELVQARELLGGNMRRPHTAAVRKMAALAGTEQFEQAGTVRDRLMALLSGGRNWEIFRTMRGSKRICAASPLPGRIQGSGEASWQVVLIDSGRLRASITAGEADLEQAGEWLDATHPVRGSDTQLPSAAQVRPSEEPDAEEAAPLPAPSFDEVKLLWSWLMGEGIRILSTTHPQLLSQLVDGPHAISAAMPKTH